MSTNTKDRLGSKNGNGTTEPFVILYSDDEFKKMWISLAYGTDDLGERMGDLWKFHIIAIVKPGEGLTLPSAQSLRLGFLGKRKRDA